MKQQVTHQLLPLQKPTFVESQETRIFCGTQKDHCLAHNSAHYSVYLYRQIQFLKGKAIPLQALTGPEGSRRLRLPDFMTIGT
jgi:hypothetical protein